MRPVEKLGGTEGWLRIAGSRVHVGQREIIRNGEPVQCSWRAFEALTALIEARGGAIERSVLFERLWPGAHVEDSSLNHCIAQLRRALGDSTIETIPRVGYRLAVPVVPEMPETVLAPEAVSEVTSTRAGSRVPRWVFYLTAVAGLAVAALGGGAFVNAQSRHTEARRLTEEGAYLLRSGRMLETTQALERLEHAAALDPSSAITQALIAESVARTGQSTKGQERADAERAVRMDPSCGECHAILGWIAMIRQWDWKTAREELATALRLDPNSAYVHLWHSQLLAASGKLDDALREVDVAKRLQPWNHAHANTKGDILYLAGRYEEAAAECQRALSLRPNYPAASTSLFRIYMMQGRYEDAIRSKVTADTQYANLSADADEQHAVRALTAFRTAGLGGAARHFLAELSGPQESLKRYDRAIWKLQAGDPDGAVAELEQGVKFHPFYMMYLRVDPMFASLRDREDFRRAISRIGV